MISLIMDIVFNNGYCISKDMLLHTNLNIFCALRTAQFCLTVNKSAPCLISTLAQTRKLKLKNMDSIATSALRIIY